MQFYVFVLLFINISYINETVYTFKDIRMKE